MSLEQHDALPVISVITICRNAEKTIERTLQSVAEQIEAAGQVEHIVVDGASTDGTMEIVGRFPHVARCISEPDQGIADAFNKGMQMASGEYLLYLNADDWLYDDRVLRDAVEFIQGQGEPDWIVGDVMVDRNGRLERAVKSHPPSCWSLILRNRICHPAVLIKKIVQLDAGGFDTSFKIAMDFDLWQRLCARHIRPTYWPRVVSVFAMEGVSSMGGARRDEEHQAIMKRARNTAIKRLVGVVYDLYQRVR